MIFLFFLVEQEMSKPEKSGDNAETAKPVEVVKEGGVGSSEEKKEAAPPSIWFCVVLSIQAFDNGFMVVAWIFELYVAYFTVYLWNCYFWICLILQSRRSIISLA